MNENELTKKRPLSAVRFGLGKEIRLFDDEIVVTGQEEGKELAVPLAEVRRLILTPGDPNPSKLILMADMDDDTTVLLAEGMSNARGFREMLPRLQELAPHVQLDPPDMGEQLRQALNTRRAWALTCYGTILLICILLYGLYLIVALVGSHVHH
jgi:hypothetical protein